MFFYNYRFPVQESEKMKWIQVCHLNENEDVKSKFVCSHHFTIDDFDTTYWPQKRLL